LDSKARLAPPANAHALSMHRLRQGLRGALFCQFQRRSLSLFIDFDGRMVRGEVCGAVSVLVFKTREVLSKAPIVRLGTSPPLTEQSAGFDEVKESRAKIDSFYSA
jgi:hypothetical protein